MEDTQLRLAEYLKVDSLNDIVLIQKSNRAPV
jgi:serine/threonine protein kinase